MSTGASAAAILKVMNCQKKRVARDSKFIKDEKHENYNCKRYNYIILYVYHIYYKIIHLVVCNWIIYQLIIKLRPYWKWGTVKRVARDPKLIKGEKRKNYNDKRYITIKNY